MARILIIVPSNTYRATSFINAASRMEVEVIVACDSLLPIEKLPSPGTFSVGALSSSVFSSGTSSLDATYPDTSPASTFSSSTLQISLDNLDESTEQILKLDNILPLDAIIAIDDKGVALAAAATTALGLKGNKLEAATRTLHKDLLRKALSETEVPQPAYSILGNNASPQDVTNAIDAIGLPCVVKATSLSASQGVIRANSYPEVDLAIERIRKIQATEGRSYDPILIERYIDGDEIAVEGLLTDGKLTILAIFDKPIPLVGPFFEESIYVTPSVHDSSLLQSAIDVTHRSVAALQLREGPIHAEVRFENGRAYLIEVASRTIGGQCSNVLQFDNGRSLEEVVLASSLGMEPHAYDAGKEDTLPNASLGAIRTVRAVCAGQKHLQIIPGYSGVCMISAQEKGVIKAIEGVDMARQVESVTGVNITTFPGAEVAPVPDGSRYIGFVFARDSSRTKLIDSLRKAASMIYTVIEQT